MTDLEEANLKQRFLHLHVIGGMRYSDVVTELKVPNSTLTEWYEELREERIKIALMRNLWNRKKIPPPFSDFYEWYLSQEKKCAYCDITEAEIERLIDGKNLDTKRLAKRGKKLELDRKQPDLEYDDLNNITFACYWCNNAKTDTFTYEEFKKVGKIFKEIWQNRLSQLSQ